MNANSRFKLWMLAALTAAASFSAPAQTNQSGPKSFDFFKLITERNIFDPSRQPPLIVQPRQRPVIVDTFALAGTMSYESGMFAVFDGNNNDYHKVLSNGGRIAGYTVSAIGHDSAKLTSGTNEVELKVGMQMRRSQDGKWSPSENSGENQYSFNSTSRRFGTRNNDRNDRGDRTRSNNGFQGRNGFRTGNNRTYNGGDSNMAGQNDGGAGGPDSGGASASSGDPN